MNAPEDTRFVLLLAKREDPDVMALARALAAVRKTPVQDQVLAARGAWGIVAEDLGEDEAGALAEALGASGVECLVRPRSALVELHDAVPATALGDLPAARPILIAVAGMTVTTTTTKKVKEGPSPGQKAVGAAIMMSTGLPIKIGGRARPVEKTEKRQDLAFYVELCYEDPAGRVQIAASQFDYSVLKERMLYQAQANCKLLVGDLVAAAPGAWQNHGARVLLEGRPIRTMGYGSLEDLAREERWLLTLRGLGE